MLPFSNLDGSALTAWTMPDVRRNATLRGVVNPNAFSFSAATAPLVEQFGDRLTLWRDGNRVQWSCEEQTVLVELLADGSLDATFVDHPMHDAVTGRAANAIFRRNSGIAYRLTSDGCARMIADMTAFFTGEREPLFSFVAAEEAN
jgi:hypothetical protein